jgi:hypothetical protein
MLRSTVIRVLALPILLAACNPSSRSSAPDVSAPAAAAPAPSTALPAGSGCAASVSRFKTLIDTDLATGHTTKSVHAQVSQEISSAAQLCSAGNDAGARAAIAASRARHGYPAG